eukprot:251961_1
MYQMKLHEHDHYNQLYLYLMHYFVVLMSDWKIEVVLWIEILDEYLQPFDNNIFLCNYNVYILVMMIILIHDYHYQIIVFLIDVSGVFNDAGWNWSANEYFTSIDFDLGFELVHNIKAINFFDEFPFSLKQKIYLTG